MKANNTIKKITKYAAGASALLVTNSAQAEIITNDIEDLCFEPTTIGESLSMDINGDGFTDIRLFAYDPSFDDVYIILEGTIGVEDNGNATVYPMLSDVDFDCATAQVSSAGSINGLGPAVTGQIPLIFNIGADQHFGVVEITTVAGTGSQADDVRKVIIHSYTYNDLPIDEGGCTITAIELGVDMVKFDAYGVDDKVVLEWATAREENNSGFEIERSADGKIWNTIGFESGRGNAFEESNYSWVDKSPIAPQSYYRLKQKDFNGETSYSQVLSVKITQTKSKVELSAYPNPTTDYLSYNLPSENNTEHELSLWSMEGKIILRKQVSNDGLRVLNLSTLESGTYILNIKMASNNYSKLITKS